MNNHVTKSETLNINNYIKLQNSLDTLRFITCGSVDDGKSTLIGRMLFESNLIFDDQISSLEKDSKKSGTQGENIDFALLVDGLIAEREQGITIDVAYRFFSTKKRKFIVADTPGHEEYTRNMFTGASTADLAIILIDARKGILTQTKRHSIICSTLGIKQVLLAVNKMDLINYDEENFNTIFDNYKLFSSELNFKSINAIPISALIGDNIVTKSKSTKWYKGKALLDYLEGVKKSSSQGNNDLIFPIQYVNRRTSEYRGYLGTLISGKISKNQDITILPSKQKAKVKDIIYSGINVNQATKDQSISITFNKDIDVSRGDIVVDENCACNIADQFQVTLIWLDNTPGYVGRSYFLKIGCDITSMQITSIRHRININTFDKISASNINLNDLCIINIKLSKKIVYQKYENCKELGSFILIDKTSNKTIAGGMINYPLNRSNNILTQEIDIDRKSRQNLLGQKNKVFWFTGISGSGKSTIANALANRLHKKGHLTYILDGDNIRKGLNYDLGFTKTDRIENIRRISEVTKLMFDSGIIVITAFISPFIAEREMARNLFDDKSFIEIFVDVPIEVATERDVKGLYKKYKEGKIKNFTGFDSEYETPPNPDFHFKTDEVKLNDIIDTLLENVSFEL